MHLGQAGAFAEAVRRDQPAAVRIHRRPDGEIVRTRGAPLAERYLSDPLENAGGGEALDTLASMVDAMQVLADDEKLVPIH